MCEANVYLLSAGEEREVMKDVLLVRAEGEDVLLVDFLGRQQRLRGRLVDVDLGHHKIVVEQAR